MDSVKKIKYFLKTYLFIRGRHREAEIYKEGGEAGSMQRAPYEIWQTLNRWATQASLGTSF